MVVANFALLFLMGLFSDHSNHIIVHDLENDRKIRKAIFSGDRSEYEQIFKKKLYQQIVKDVNDSHPSIRLQVGTLAKLMDSPLLTKIMGGFLSLSPTFAALNLAKFVLDTGKAGAAVQYAANTVLGFGGDPHLMPALFEAKGDITSSDRAELKNDIKKAEAHASMVYEQSLASLSKYLLKF